jgi:PAS domain S-box-containing protein
MADKPSYEDLEQRVQELENEILQLRQVKNAVGGAEENIYSFLDELRDGFFVSDNKGFITYANKALTNSFGYENPQEAVGKHFSEHLSPKMIEDVTVKFNRAMRDEDYSELVEFPALRKDGSTVFVQLKHSPVMEGGMIAGTKGIIRDITAQKKAEKGLLESERWTRALLDAITESVFLIDGDGNIQAINKTAAERFGGTVETFTGLCVNDLMPPHLAESRKAKHEEVFRTGLPLRAEDERDGDIYDTNIYPICNRDGKVTAIAIYSMRITEQKRALNALRESEERYRSLFEDNHSTMLLVDPNNSDIVDANPAACVYYGYSKEEITNKKITDINILPREQIRRQMVGPGARNQHSFFFQHRLANGEIRNVECFICPITLNGKELRYTLVYDITDRIQAEEALRESGERIRALFNAITESAILADPEGNIQAINQTAARRFGGTVEKLTGKCLWDLMAPPDVNLRKAKHDEAIQSKAAVRFQAEREGEFYDSNLNPIFDRDGKVMSLAIFSIQITEQKRALEALQESEEKYRFLIESMNDGLVVLDDNNSITYVNDRFLDMIGYARDEVIGRNPMHFCPEESVKIAAKQIVERRKGKKGFYETYWNKKHGGQVPTIMSASPIMDDTGRYEGSFAIIIDITEIKKIEHALRQSEKELKAKTSNLEEVNAALRVLLEQREKDKSEIEEKLLFNVKELVIPYLERMKNSGLDTNQNGYLDILESNLNDIISPFSRNLSLKFMSLTPTEIQVANHIKQGRTTKEIADSFHISSKTIEDHRKNLRKKLGITNRKTNLRTHLLAMQ